MKKKAILKYSFLLIISYFVFVSLALTLEQLGVLSLERQQDNGGKREIAWQEHRSGYLNIYFEPDADLKAIHKRLHRRLFYVNSPGKTPALADSREKIAYRLDRLLERVMEVLDMYPAERNLNIKVFKKRRELSEEYYRIFRKRANPKAFYVHKYRTIYASESDMTDTVIAHEMGHAVVDSYFRVIPPEKIGEMLANYVDMHLEE
ncbi:MAG: hypothetical protein AB1481_04665 [Candidatus Omnitrophota bacterium]